MRATIIFAFLSLITSRTCAQEGNPFESIGKEGKILTLSKGKYLEIENNDSLQRIGSVIVNKNTGQLYEILDADTLYQESDLNPTIITRWWSVDPLATKYPNMSPYAAVANNPIIYKDTDGRDFEIVIDDVNHTITIKATYYTADQYFVNEVVGRALNDINSKNFLVKTNEGVSYSLKFDLALGNYSNNEGSGMGVNPENSEINKSKAIGDNSANYINEITSNVLALNGLVVYPNGEWDYDYARYGRTEEGGDDIQLSSGTGSDLQKKCPYLKDPYYKYYIAIHEILHSLGVNHGNMYGGKANANSTFGTYTVLAILNYASKLDKNFDVGYSFTLPKGAFGLKSDITIPYSGTTFYDELKGEGSEVSDYPKVVYKGEKVRLNITSITSE